MNNLNVIFFASSANRKKSILEEYSDVPQLFISMEFELLQPLSDNPPSDKISSSSQPIQKLTPLKTQSSSGFQIQFSSFQNKTNPKFRVDTQSSDNPTKHPQFQFKDSKKNHLILLQNKINLASSVDGKESYQQSTSQTDKDSSYTSSNNTQVQHDYLQLFQEDLLQNKYLIPEGMKDNSILQTSNKIPFRSIRSYVRPSHFDENGRGIRRNTLMQFSFKSQKSSTPSSKQQEQIQNQDKSQQLNTKIDEMKVQVQELKEQLLQLKETRSRQIQLYKNQKIRMQQREQEHIRQKQIMQQQIVELKLRLSLQQEIKITSQEQEKQSNGIDLLQQNSDTIKALFQNVQNKFRNQISERLSSKPQQEVTKDGNTCEQNSTKGNAEAVFLVTCDNGSPQVSRQLNQQIQNKVYETQNLKRVCETLKSKKQSFLTSLLGPKASNGDIRLQNCSQISDLREGSEGTSNQINVINFTLRGSINRKYKLKCEA